MVLEQEADARLILAHPVWRLYFYSRGVILRAIKTAQKSVLGSQPGRISQQDGHGFSKMCLDSIACGYRIKAITPAFQAGDGGSIPPTRSIENLPSISG